MGQILTLARWPRALQVAIATRNHDSGDGQIVRIPFVRGKAGLSRLLRPLLTVLLLPSKRLPEAFEKLQKLNPEGARAEASGGTSDDARAGLSEHKGLTNGNGAKPAEVDLASRPAPRRSIFGRLSRSGAREGPGFLSPSGLTNGGGLTNGSGRVNGGRVNGGRTNGGRVNGSRVNGGRVNGGRVNGSRVNGGRVNGSRVNGGRVNGSRVNGGRVNGGRTSGGLVNGSGLLLSERIRERRRRSTRRTALFLALLIFTVAFFGPLLFYGFFGAPPVVIDGSFSDWAGVPVVPDSATDQLDNDDINLVAFAALQGDRDLYFYAQVAQRGRPFQGNTTPPVAESFRLLIDRDRSASTGFAAFGLGVDYIVELSGYDGQLRSSSLRAFPSSSPDPTDTTFFSTAGAIRAIARGNQIEGSVPLLDLGSSSPSSLPYLLLLAQDSAGRQDLGDAVFSSRPGVLVLTQTPSGLGTLPDDSDVLLLEVEGRALHQNITLASLLIAVDGENGGGVALAYATFVGRNQTLNTSAVAGQTIRINFTQGGPLTFAVLSGSTTISIFGRATGAPSVATVRLAVNGSQFALTGEPPASTSGHASIFPPFTFERSYAGAAPPSIRIDGAFADWGPLRPFDLDGGDDLVTGAPPYPGNATTAPSPINQNIDIRESRADVNSGTAEVSFYLSVDGSIMAGKLLEPPTYPRPTQPTTGGGGGGGQPPGRSPDSDVASIYVDTDFNALTGWAAVPGIGVDAIVQIAGKGGAYGRAPRTTETSLALWDGPAQAFNRSVRAIPVGYASSKLETQLPSADLCPSSASCPRVRYIFFLQDLGGTLDLTDSFSGNFRGDGEALLFDEGPPRARFAYQGDRSAPALSFSLASPSSNARTAVVYFLMAALDGVSPSDVTRVAVYADGLTLGVLDAQDLAAGPLAESALDPGGLARLTLTSNLTLPPGSRIDALLTLDISPTSGAPLSVNATIARVFGVFATGISDVRYSSAPYVPSLRILGASAGSRSQNTVIINELNFLNNWVEIMDQTGSSISLTSPAQMGIEIWRTNGAGTLHKTEAIIRFSGSTSAEGFAAVNATLTYSTAGKIYWVSLWCSNCSAGRIGQNNNTTYVDSVRVPLGSAVGAWGRYPDANATFRNTTNNTRADNNEIPEFEEMVLPAAGVALAVLVVRRRRPPEGLGGPNGDPPAPLS